MSDKPNVKLPKAPDAYTGKTILFTPARDGVTIPVQGELTCYLTGAGTNLCATYVAEAGRKAVTYWFNQAEVESLGLA